MLDDDIVSLLLSGNTPQPLLAGLGEAGGNAQYGQGRILAWDATTFENRIAYRGAEITNMSVLSGPDALTYRQDDVVAVMSFSPNRGATAYWIMGRVIVPGPGRGAEAIEWMTGELGRSIAASVFADRVRFDEVFPSENGATGTFGDLATFGPQIADIEITEAGKLLVFMACSFAPPAAGFASGFMSFELEGPSPQSAQFATAVDVGFNGPNDGQMFVAMTKHETVDNMLPGIYTVTAKYGSGNVNGPDVFFTNRELMTIAF